MKSSRRSIEAVTDVPSLKTSEKGSGKTVLITGCSEGGIGSALAFAFHRHGCRVFATARDLRKVQHLNQAGIEVLELDVLNEVSCRKAAELVREATGGTLNVLVNNSGVGEFSPQFMRIRRLKRGTDGRKDISCHFLTLMSPK